MGYGGFHKWCTPKSFIYRWTFPYKRCILWGTTIYENLHMAYHGIPDILPDIFFETQMSIELVEPNMTLRIVSWSEMLVYGKVLDHLDS